MIDKSLWERTPDARYHVDAAFRQLVDMMEAHMHSSAYTPTEMREAALLAAIHYEHRAIRHAAGYTMSEEATKSAWATIEELYHAISDDFTRGR
jgi:hypothetical protein